MKNNIKTIVNAKSLIKAAMENIHLSSTVEQRRQIKRLKELIEDGSTLGENDSDVVRATYEVIKHMREIKIVRYGIVTYSRWSAGAPNDLVQMDIKNKDLIYKFDNTNLLDAIRMYANIGEKAELASTYLLDEIFKLSVGIDIRNPIDALRDMSIQHLNPSTENAVSDEIEALNRLANFIDSQNSKGAFAATLLYPILNSAYGKKRKHAMLGYGSNTGKGLILALIDKLYVGAAVKVPPRPKESDNFNAGSWNMSIVDKWLVLIGDTSEDNITYDFMKNMYEHPLYLATRGGGRSTKMFYGNFYIASNHRRPFFGDKEISSRVFFTSTFADIDKALGEDVIKTLDEINRDSIIKYIIDNEELARSYWSTYETPEDFYKDNTLEIVYEQFMKQFDDQIVPVETLKKWVVEVTGRVSFYKEFKAILDEYIGKPRQLSVGGKRKVSYDLRKDVAPNLPQGKLVGTSTLVR